MNSFVKIRDGWQWAGRVGLVLASPICTRQYPLSGGQSWTPVLWEDEEDPDFFKTAGLESCTPKKRVGNRLLKRLVNEGQ